MSDIGVRARQRMGAGDIATVRSWYPNKRFAGKRVTVVKAWRGGLVTVENEAQERWTLHNECVESEPVA